MKRRDIEPIRKLIFQYLRQEGLEGPLNERRLLDSWAELMGPQIASCTQDLYIRNQTLHVQLSSAVLRHELFMTRELIVRKLNQHVGATVITNMMFH